MPVTSAVTTFNVTLPATETPDQLRELKIFIDGALQDVKNLPGPERHVTQLMAPTGSLVRLELMDDSLTLPRTCSFKAGKAREEITINDIAVCVMGDLLGSSSCSR